MNTKDVKIDSLLWGESVKQMTLEKFTAVCNGYAENGKCKKPSKDEVEKLHNKLTGKKVAKATNPKGENTKK